MAVGRFVVRGDPLLSPEEIAANDAPFHAMEYKADMRRFASLVPN